MEYKGVSDELLSNICVSNLDLFSSNVMIKQQHKHTSSIQLEIR